MNKTYIHDKKAFVTWKKVQITISEKRFDNIYISPKYWLIFMSTAQEQKLFLSFVQHIILAVYYHGGVYVQAGLFCFKSVDIDILI